VASSPEVPDGTDAPGPWSPDDERVPRPWLAIVALTIAGLTILIGIGAAVVAGFVIDRP
jgi:hypothetical protein